jgi:D-alanyl-D-alanine carboxypeptidase
MYLAAVLFLTLSQALGISEGSKSLFCADRVTFTLRESSTSEGCLENERSLGASAITKSKVGASGIHPKVNLRFKVAERAAREAGIKLYIASGFRTLERQRYLFERAILKYGSEKEAAKWVLPPHLSNHPRGLALDINYPGDKSGAAWLEKYGYRFGLCRVFDNEWWHFEATTSPGESCPPRLPDAGILLD